jgi:hypothetical protein
MANETSRKSDDKDVSLEKGEYWCNFCGYSTDILPDYLAHSCVEVIEAKGQKVVPTGQNECR